LETERLILRPREEDEAAIYRQLWTERDPRVPPHRRIDPEGRPTLEDIAAEIRVEHEQPGPAVLAVERKGMADLIGYSGLVFHGNGSPDEPELRD
jgi:[ribosomal protein S5]-alanine N-acetyltransferase